MATLPLGVRVFLCTQATDMRKSFDGLIAATKTLIGADPLSGHLFVFVNHQANYAKVLYWSRGGYCLWATMAPGVSVQMTDTELMMRLDGIEYRHTVQRKRFTLPAAAHASRIIESC